MPYMDHDMLDLFGEESVKDDVDKFGDTGNKLVDELDKWKPSLNPALPEAPALFHRLDESYRSGCCQRLAWSKTGAIGYIPSDQRKVIFRTTARNPETNLWALTGDLSESIEAPEGIRFTHIQWSRLGLDLVALDQYGHHHVYSSVNALDRLREQMTLVAQPPNVSTPVVGLHWLPIHPQQFRAFQISPSIKVGDDWTSYMGTVSVDWPHNAIDGKTAFLTVAQSHLLQIVYQQDGHPWAAACTTLGDTANSEDVLTHAAFADASQQLYLVTYSNRGCLRLYKVGIEWNTLPSADGSRGMLQAQLSVEGLEVIDQCHPQPKLGTYDQTLRESLARSRLSSLTILPPAPSTTSDAGSPFQILAVFTHAGDRSTFGASGGSSCSSIVRWEISQREPELLEAFKNLKSSNNKLGTTEAMITLERKDDWVTSRVVLGIDTIHSESTVALKYSDGSVEFRKREDLSLVIADTSYMSAGLPPLSGFEYTSLSKDKLETSPSDGFNELATRQHGCSEMILAPDACMTTLVNSEDKLELKVMEYAPGWSTHSLDELQTQQALVSVAREFAILTSLQISSDEPFALLPSDLPITHRRFVMKQIYKILQRPVEFTTEDSRKYTQRALRDTVTAKAFSLQLVLGYRDTPNSFDQTGKLAFTTLNLRSVVTCVAHTITPKEPVWAEAIISLQPSIRWSIDLTVLILGDLHKIYQWRQSRTSGFVLNDLNDFVHELNSPSLLALLCATPRSLLRMLLDLIKVYCGKARQSVCQSGAQRALIQEIVAYTLSMPFKLPRLEQLLVEIDNSIRTAYTNANLSTQQRVDAEVTMLVDGRIPDCLGNAIDFLTGEAAAKILDSVDMGKINFWDVDWLGLRDSTKEDGRTQRRKYDVIRKTRIRDGMKLRSCRRCGSLMEDVVVGSGGRERGAIPPWLMQAQRYCVCLGYWMLEN